MGLLLLKYGEGDAGMEKVYIYNAVDGRQCVDVTNIMTGEDEVKCRRYEESIAKRDTKNGDIDKVCDDYVFISIFPLSSTLIHHILFSSPSFSSCPNIPSFAFLCLLLYSLLSSLDPNWSYICSS